MKHLPVCFGTYEEGHPSCDGKQLKELPCTARDRCLALRLHCAKLGKKRQDYLRFVERDGEEYSKPRELKVLELLDTVVVKRGIRDGREGRVLARKRPKKRAAPRPAASAPPRTAKAKKAAARGTALAARERRVENWFLVEWFVSRLSEQAGRRVAETRGGADPGDFFLLEKKRYISICARIDEFRHRTFATVYLRPRLRRIEVRVAVEHFYFEKLFAASDRARLKVEDFSGRDGMFSTRFVDLDQERAAMAADGIALAIKRGILDLTPSA